MPREVNVTRWKQAKRDRYYRSNIFFFLCLACSIGQHDLEQARQLPQVTPRLASLAQATNPLLLPSLLCFVVLYAYHLLRFRRQASRRFRLKICR